ncbi:MAG: hypothetical protein JWM58_4036 [Rhizobium sp.]|nr:hypothetical protein [Rhizobium sp.]
MTRLQALLLGLELSAMVWLGALISGQWIFDKAYAPSDPQITSNLK